MAEVDERGEFSRIKAQADKVYRSVVRAKCPALNAEVNFSSDGFHHLQYNSSRVERSKEVQRIKFLCLKDAIEVIKKTTTIQEYREAIQPVGKVGSHGFRSTKVVKYYGFVAITSFDKPRRIKVIIRKVGDGSYQFWSVMPSWREERINSSQSVRRVGDGTMLDD